MKPIKNKGKVERFSKTASTSKSLASMAFNQTPGEVKFEEEPTLEGAVFQDMIWTLYGRPKIGKTSLAALIPGVYMIMTEPGVKFKKVRKTYIKNWGEFMKFVILMEKSPSNVATVKCWAIDTTDVLAKFCMQYVCGRDNISHPTDSEWGKGWEALADEFMHWTLRLVALGHGVLFVCHEKDREIIIRSVARIQASPALGKTCHDIISNMSDATLHFSILFKREVVKGKVKGVEQRCIFTRPRIDGEGGDRTGLLPEVIEVKTEQEALNVLLNACKGKTR